MPINTTLYTQIVNSTAAVTWTLADHDYHKDMYGVLLGKFTAANMATELDYLNDLNSETDYRIAMSLGHSTLILGLESEAILVEVKRTLAQVDFRKHVPENFADNFLTQRASAGSYYGYARDCGYQLGRWDDTLGYLDFQGVCAAAGNKGVDLGDPVDNSYTSNNRAYDENAETLDFFMSLYILDKINNLAAKTYALSTLWEYINSYHWSVDHYDYRGPAWTGYECEGAFLALLVAQTRARNGYTLLNTALGTDYWSRILTDIHNRFLVSGWDSPQWTFNATRYYCIIHHHTDNSERRLRNTLGSWLCLHAFYQVLPVADQAAIVALISGGKQAWGKFLSTSTLFDDATHKFTHGSGVATSDWATTVGIVTLWLLGICPDTGSLYVPIFEDHYEITEFNRYWHFDSTTRKIRIPVKAGKLKFLYGSTYNSTTDVLTEVITEHFFPKDGVYDVTFNAAYTQITEVSFIETLDPKLYYVAEPNPVTSTNRLFCNIEGEFTATFQTLVETVTLKKMVLSPLRDPDTGWYLWHYEDESASMVLAPKGSAQSWKIAGKVCKYDYVGVTPSQVAVDDVILTSYGRALKVVTASKIVSQGLYKYTLCDLEEYALALEGSVGEPTVTGNDARERTLTYLNTYLTGLTPLRYIVAYDTPAYTIEKLFIEKGLDLVFGIGEPTSTMLKDCSQYPYGYEELVPVTMYSVDKGTVSATKLTYAAEAELRKELEAHPFGSLRSMDKRSKKNIEGGAFIIYCTEYILTYVRDTS